VSQFIEFDIGEIPAKTGSRSVIEPVRQLHPVESVAVEQEKLVLWWKASERVRNEQKPTGASFLEAGDHLLNRSFSFPQFFCSEHHHFAHIVLEENWRRGINLSTDKPSQYLYLVENQAVSFFSSYTGGGNLNLQFAPKSIWDQEIRPGIRECGGAGLNESGERYPMHLSM
jgi:hypothetical protein